jgi:small subunit ribosomal protein S6
MAYYEHVLIARQDISGQAVDALAEEFAGIIRDNGGTVTKTENWGLRTLAYRIKKNRKGHYVLMNIDAPPAAVAEMERLEKINEDVIRAMTIRVDALDEEPSPVLRSRDDRDRDRDDRRREGGRF